MHSDAQCAGGQFACQSQGAGAEWAEFHRDSLLDMWGIVSVAEARHVDGYRIWLRFNTQEVGMVDLGELMAGPEVISVKIFLGTSLFSKETLVS